MTSREQLNIRIDAQTADLLERLKEDLEAEEGEGVTKTRLIKLAVRALARYRKLVRPRRPKDR